MFTYIIACVIVAVLLPIMGMVGNIIIAALVGFVMLVCMAISSIVRGLVHLFVGQPE